MAPYHDEVIRERVATFVETLRATPGDVQTATLFNDEGCPDCIVGHILLEFCPDDVRAIRFPSDHHDYKDGHGDETAAYRALRLVLGWTEIECSDVERANDTGTVDINDNGDCVYLKGAGRPCVDCEADRGHLSEAIAAVLAIPVRTGGWRVGAPRFADARCAYCNTAIGGNSFAWNTPVGAAFCDQPCAMASTYPSEVKKGGAS